MKALMVVVLHVATQLLAKLGDGLKGPAVNQLGFQRVEERFHVRVLVGRAAARHALSDTGGNQALTKRDAQKLAAADALLRVKRRHEFVRSLVLGVESR